MNRAADLQPDQQPGCWDDHVPVYEEVFEPLSLAFARRALDRLGIRPGDRLIDVGAGCGGAALAAAERGAQVLAVDASLKMVARIRTRANRTNGRAGELQAVVMDGTSLAVPNAVFDSALSVFGVILFPDAVRGMQEIARVLKPGGRVAVVTWTETERYELAARLIAAITEVRGPQAPPSVLPAQLRFRDEPVFRTLFTQAGLVVDDIVRSEQRWPLPSARWLADHVAFAPGMAAIVRGLGADRTPVLDAFVAALERDQGEGEVSLCAIAHAGIATRPR
jgi:ubiquinone/menaquinone biosynthesis C-methylase UbiE